MSSLALPGRRRRRRPCVPPQDGNRVRTRPPRSAQSTPQPVFARTVQEREARVRRADEPATADGDAVAGLVLQTGRGGAHITRTSMFAARGAGESCPVSTSGLPADEVPGAWCSDVERPRRVEGRGSRTRAALARQSPSSDASGAIGPRAVNFGGSPPCGSAMPSPARSFALGRSVAQVSAEGTVGAALPRS